MQFANYPGFEKGMKPQFKVKEPFYFVVRFIPRTLFSTESEYYYFNSKSMQ